MKLLLHSLRDLLVRILPDFSKKDSYKFAFLVHPRNIKDVYRKYPVFRHLPENILEFLLRMYWPVILSKVTGLKTLDGGKEVEGFILTIPLTARQMIENRELASKKIIQAIRLAKKTGAKIVGLGGLTSSLTKGGSDILEHKIGINVTTGHAYTAYNVSQNVIELSKIFNIDKRATTVAIVGAAGSIGSTTAKYLARFGFTKFILIDQARKRDHLPDVIAEMRSYNQGVDINISHQIKDVSNANIIVTATNAPEALIKTDDVRPWTIVVDDAQPSDVSEEVLKRPDVLVVEAGVVHTPGVKSNFNMNLKDRNDNFCCMAEVLILASAGWNDHYVINRATLELVDKVAEMGKKLGFRIAEFQNFNESITQEKRDSFRSHLKTNV